MSETSIVIVGGGAAGLTTGGALKMQGLEPLIMNTVALRNSLAEQVIQRDRYPWS